MTVIAMSRPEIDRMHVLRDLAAGRITVNEAAQLTRLTPRHILRLAKAYRERGPSGLVSTRRGQPSNHRYPVALRTETLGLIPAHYADFGPTLACEKLAEQHGIHLGGETVRQWMLADGLWREPRYTTLLRAIELWGAVRADGPRRLAGDEEPPAVDGFVAGREENFSQQIKADPEDGLSAAFVGLYEGRPFFPLPLAGRVGERKGYGQHGQKLANPVGVNEVGILEIEAPRLGSREERFDRPPPPVMGQGDLRIGVGGDYKQVSADQPRRSQFQCRSKQAVA